MGIHYEVLNHASSRLRARRTSHRFHVALAVLIAIAGHVIEVLVFALGWYALLMTGKAKLSLHEVTFEDIIYFSFSTYTSLGYGDIVPLGPARILAGAESLVGLVLIAWTASFTFFEMQKFWKEDK